MSTRYRVYFTPRNDVSSYGDEVEVSDLIDDRGIPNIRKAGADSNDYDIGVFTYGDISLKGFNRDGIFNDEADYRSLFRFGRDRTKVRIVFTNDSGETITFRGLINEEATRADIGDDDIDFRILSLDSVIRKNKVSGGTVTDGMSVKSAILAILNQPVISSVLTVDEANINPDYNFAIDDASKLDNRSARDVINRLLLPANSIMLIDADGVVIVRSREANEDKDILNLYGPYDIHRRQNVLRFAEYNSGLHRVFTSVRINDTESSNEAYSQQFGFRQKQIDLDFITDPDTELAIANRLVDEFKSPKIELSVDIPTSVGRDVEIFDRVSVNHPLKLLPRPGTFMPIIGITEIGDDEMPLPDAFGSLAIPDNFAFKVIEISENPNDFEMTLKLRQSGKSIDDGVFNDPNSSIIGYAVIGFGVIGDDGDPADSWNPSVVGAAKIGLTKVA